MREMKKNVIAVNFRHDSHARPAHGQPPKLFSMSELALDRDRRMAGLEMTEFFVGKNRQEK